MSAAGSLDRWGVIRAADVVSIAQAVGLDIAQAATLLDLESSGLVDGVAHYGLNVWGSDGVSTGGAYVKGSPVTQANYAAYRRALTAGTAGHNGVGPTQLTAEDWQAQADRLGGAWQWDINCRVGFQVLRSHMARFGSVRDGYVAYNGGAGAVLNRAERRNDAAEGYGDKAMARLAKWRDRLGSTAASTPTLTVEPDVTVQNIPIDASPTDGEILLRFPVGPTAFTHRGYISAVARGQGGRVRWWFQGMTAGIARRDWTPITVTDGLSSEVFDQIPAGTSKINVQYSLPGGGTICLEGST